MEEESATSQVNYTPPTVQPMDGTMWPETDPSAEFMDTCIFQKICGDVDVQSLRPSAREGPD